MIQKKWKKTKEINNVLGFLLGFGLVTIEGDLWKKHRNLIMPSFSQQNLQNMVKKIIIETNRNLNSFERTDQMIFPNFLMNISEMTLSVIMSIGFGTDSTMTSELVKDFKELLEDGQKVAVGVAAFGKWTYSLPLSHNFNFSKTKKKIQGKINLMINERKKDNMVHAGFKDLLSLMIAASDGEGNNFSNEELLDESLVSEI